MTNKDMRICLRKMTALFTRHFPGRKGNCDLVFKTASWTIWEQKLIAVIPSFRKLKLLKNGSFLMIQKTKFVISY